MSYQVLDIDGIYRASGLDAGHTDFRAVLEKALNEQKSDRGMVLVAIDGSRDGEPLYVFKHEAD